MNTILNLKKINPQITIPGAIALLMIGSYFAMKIRNPQPPMRPINLLEKVEIGGMQQWIMANGKSSDLPVLLWLHGGPGAAQMPVARYFNHHLEEDFIVVHWDQRGAGKSNPRDFDESTMTVEQYIADVHHMTQFLKKKFCREKIYLLGHSWGSQLGMLATKRYPDDYLAYIGTGQVVHHYKAHRKAFRELKTRIKKENHTKDLEKLEALQPPPYINHSDYISFIKLLDRYQMNMNINMGKMARVALFSEAYSPGDLIRWLRGASRGSGPMWDESQGWDILKRTPNIEIPCYFISGENDFNTPAILVEQMLQQPQAPAHHKHFIIPGAGHAPFLSKPEKFASIMKEIIFLEQKGYADKKGKKHQCVLSVNK